MTQYLLSGASTAAIQLCGVPLEESRCGFAVPATAFPLVLIYEAWEHSVLAEDVWQPLGRV